MAMQTVNERSALFVTFVFTDELDAPVVPTTIDWRLDDRTNDQQVTNWTVVNTPASTVQLTIPGISNAIVDATRAWEIKTVTVRADLNLTTESNQVHHYRVKNLAYAP